MFGFTALLFITIQAIALDASDAAGGDWRRFEGAAASFEFPVGMLVEESTNGQVYFLDIRRAEVRDDDAFASLRVVVVPFAEVSLEAMADGLRRNAQEVFEQRGATLRGSEELRSELAGAERIGERLRYANDAGAGWILDLHGFLVGNQTFAVLAKARTSRLEADQAVHERILRSLTLREIDGTEPIQARVGSVGIRLPAMHLLKTEWTGDPPLGTAQLRIREGLLTMNAQFCRDEQSARVVEESTFEEFVKRVRRDAESSGGALALEGQAAGLIVAGAHVLPFRRIAIRVGDQRHEILAAVVRDGAWIFALQLTAAQDQLKEAESRFTELLASLDFTHPQPAPLRIAGRGLSWTLPAWAKPTVYPAPQFILQADVDHASANELPSLFVEWRTDFPADRHAEMHSMFRAKLFPDAEPTWTGEWTIPGPLGAAIFLVSVLGEQGQRGLLATAARPWRDSALAVVLTLPHARNAVQAEGYLHRVLGDVAVLAPGESVRLRDGRAYLDLPDGAWLGWEIDAGQRTEVAVAAPWGEWHLSLGADDEDGPLADHQLLSQAGSALSEARERHAGNWRDRGARVEDWVELAGLGRVARVRQDLTNSDRNAFVEAYAANVSDGVVRIWLYAEGAANAAARADVERLLGAVGCDPVVE